MIVAAQHHWNIILNYCWAVLSECTSLTLSKFFKLSQEVQKFCSSAEEFETTHVKEVPTEQKSQHFPSRYSLFPLRCALWWLATWWRFVSSGVPTLSATWGLWLFLSGQSCSSTLVSVGRRRRRKWVWKTCSNMFIVISYFYANSLFASGKICSSVAYLSRQVAGCREWGWTLCFSTGEGGKSISS